jgi:transcriptional regulator with XRE-family HTH domain
MTTFENYSKETEVTDSYSLMVISLVDRRKDLGYSQEALADIIGCTTSLIHKWEQYKRVPSGFMLTCWLDALGVEIKICPKSSE